MKKVALIILILTMLVSCASTDFSLDTESTSHIQVLEEGKVYDFTCTIGLKTGDGVVIDSKCIGFVQTDTGTYKCSVDVGSNGQPVTKELNIKQYCNLELTP